MNPDIIPASSEPRAELVSSTAVAQIVAAREGPARTATKRTDEWLSVRGVEPRRPVAQLGLL